MTDSNLKGKTLFITGGSRGIGRAIALRCAEAGVNVVLAAKSDKPHPKLPGTIHSVADEIAQLGGEALPIKLDVQDADAVGAAMEQAAKHFGGIDFLINNAGAIRLQGVEKLPIKRYDLMQAVNSRAVFVCSQAALPWLKQSSQGHILSLAPPINLAPKWFAPHAPYTLSKYGMTLLSIGMAEEFRRYGIAVNTLWPQTLIATAAIEFEVGGEQMLARGRKPQIMADAALRILQQSADTLTGQCLIDETVLAESGVTDFEQYRHTPGGEPLLKDLFLD